MDCLPLAKVLHSIIYYSIEVKGRILVEEDWSTSKEDSHNNELSYNSDENPNLGHNHRYVKFLSNGLKAS